MGNTNILQKITNERLLDISTEVMKLSEYKTLVEQAREIHTNFRNSYSEEAYKALSKLEEIIFSESYLETKVAYIKGLKDGLNIMSAAAENKTYIDS